MQLIHRFLHLIIYIQICFIVKIKFRPFIKGTNWALVGLLSLLGFAGCGQDEEGVVEYGSPHADYKIKGKVTNEAEVPLSDIQVEIQFDSYPNANTIKSNKQGEFEWKETLFPRSQTIKVITTDIDGEANGGAFESDTTEVIFTREDLKGGGGSWYEGSAEKSIQIKLKEKANE